ncbi:MAG TPA: Nramp family divalent metal transporter [Terriglobales bacterium]|nr:Nramp family divalent metal transporter [Terriglobales bacterium]
MTQPTLKDDTTKTRAYKRVFRKRPFFNLMQVRLLAFFAILGPGFITANVDNDPGGILTYSQAGAKFGYALLWTLIPTTIALMVVQEMAARMGVVTGKGLSDLIRENFGIRAAAFTILVLGIADFGNIVAEFAGLATGMSIFKDTSLFYGTVPMHVLASKYVVVPAGAALVWAVVVKGSYKPVERILILFSLIYFCYPISAFYAHPDWHKALHDTLVPTFSRNSEYLVMVIGLVGTTITPWMQFYLQASVVEKEIPKDKYNLCRLDVFLGCIITDVVAFFIVVACAATLYVTGQHDITDASQAAVALKPLAGEFAALLFAVGLVNASLLSAAILPLATAYNICEGLGVESGVNKKFSEAPVFYWLYTFLIVCGAGVVLIPKLPLIKVMIFSQVANGVLLPFVLIYMLLLVNKRELMGEYKNSTFANVIAWSTGVVMILLTIGLVWNTITS